jgi:hypothetical protein
MKKKKKQVDYKELLNRCERVVKELGLEIHYTHNLDSFYKGDLDGKRIFIGNHLSDDDKLFNLLHLSGHSVQWNVDDFLRNLGSHLFLHPDDKLLKKLQTYEWQANCYALSILHKAGEKTMDGWLTKKYVTDMLYLTYFYKTGKKLKRVTKLAKSYPFKKRLKPKRIPAFVPEAMKRTRNGLVISFD